MHNRNTAAAVYAVLQSSLEAGLGMNGEAGAQPVACGFFGAVDEAFAVARSLADLERDRWEHLTAKDGYPSRIEIVDTEWGYEVRHAGLAVTHFWIHDTAATTLQI